MSPGDKAEYDAPSLVPPVWSSLHPERIPTKVIVIVESTNGESTSFSLMHSNDCEEWQAMGLLNAALSSVEIDWCETLEGGHEE